MGVCGGKCGSEVGVWELVGSVGVGWECGSGVGVWSSVWSGVGRSEVECWWEWDESGMGGSVGVRWEGVWEWDMGVGWVGVWEGVWQCGVGWECGSEYGRECGRMSTEITNCHNVQIL